MNWRTHLSQVSQSLGCNNPVCRCFFFLTHPHHAGQHPVHDQVLRVALQQHSAVLYVLLREYIESVHGGEHSTRCQLNINQSEERIDICQPMRSEYLPGYPHCSRGQCS